MISVRAVRPFRAVLITGVFAASLLTACEFDPLPGDIAEVIAYVRPTPDLVATRAMATIEAVMRAPAPFTVELREHESATLAPTATLTPAATPIPTATATPTATPNLPATETAMRRQIASAVAATLTAQPTATAQPTSTPTPAGVAALDAAPAFAGTQMIGVVDGNEMVNLRTGPGTDFGVLTGVNPGEELLVLGRSQDAGWLRVRTATGTLGWMSALYVRTGQPATRYPIAVDTPAPEGMP